MLTEFQVHIKGLSLKFSFHFALQGAHFDSYINHNFVNDSIYPLSQKSEKNDTEKQHVQRLVYFIYEFTIDILELAMKHEASNVSLARELKVQSPLHVHDPLMIAEIEIDNN